MRWGGVGECDDVVCETGMGMNETVILNLSTERTQESPPTSSGQSLLTPLRHTAAQKNLECSPHCQTSFWGLSSCCPETPMCLGPTLKSGCINRLLVFRERVSKVARCGCFWCTCCIMKLRKHQVNIGGTLLQPEL